MNEELNNLLTLKELEKGYILYVMKNVKQKTIRAAPILGITLRTLQRKLYVIRNEIIERHINE